MDVGYTKVKSYGYSLNDRAAHINFGLTFSAGN